MKTWKTVRGTDIIRVISGRSNVFLVSVSGKYVLFDTCSHNYKDLLFSRLEKLNITRIDALVLSHTHFDHAGNASDVRKSFQAKVVVHEQEAGFLEKGENPPIRGTMLLTRSMVHILGEKLEKRLKYPPCKPDVLVCEPVYALFPGFPISLLHTPGHSPGMLSMVIDKEIALVGDTLFGIFPGSVFPPFAMDAEQLILSWNKLLDTGCNWFFPSHGRPISRNLLQKSYRTRL